MRMLPKGLTPDTIAGWVVLVVDDEPDNLEVASRLLMLFGAKVYTAQDGDAGLEILKDIKPTLILSDLSMPKKDGWELLRIIREQNKLKDVPVIALTAHAMAGDKERALKAGFDDYITKPLKVENFFADIQRCLTNHAKKAEEATGEPAKAEVATGEMAKVEVEARAETAS
jgi:CheY-like chemotaxis protein